MHTDEKKNADIFGHFLKSTVEKSLTYAVGLIMHNLKQSICGNKQFTTSIDESPKSKIEKEKFEIIISNFESRKRNL